MVLAYGVSLIAAGDLTVGLLIGFLLYVTNFYTPLRQLASIWSSLQLALAAFDRISEVLALKSDMDVVPAEAKAGAAPVLQFDNVSFRYPDGKDVLKSVSFALERGKTYALIGPTGGGKTTTASLMARLYDPSAGTRVARWQGHQGVLARGAGEQDRLHPSGAVPVYRHGARQHCLRQCGAGSAER